MKLLNVNRIWDFPTARWATVIDIDNEDNTMLYLLDNSVPLTLEYPSRWRTDCEIANSWRNSHGHIWASNDTIERIP